MKTKSAKQETAKFNLVLGRKIKHYRELMGWTQEMLQEKLGYNSTGMIPLIESGQRGMEPVKIVKASKLFGINVAVLMVDEKLSNEQMNLLESSSAILTAKNKTSKYKRLKDILTR